MSLKSFFSRLGQSLAENPVASSGGGPVRRYFSRRLGARLAGRIVEYIEHGDASSVLSDCAQNDAKQKWRGKYGYWQPEKSDRVFAQLSKWRIDQMVRFGEVVATLDPITHEWGQFGTKSTPDWLRHVVANWLAREDFALYRGPNQITIKQPVETLVDLSREGGLGVSGALEILFSRDAHDYNSKTALARFDGVEAWLRKDAETIAAEAVGIAAGARVELATAIGRFKLHSAYLEFLLDLATGTAKGARTSATQALTGADHTELAEAIKARFAKATAAKRAHLVDVAAATLGGEAEPIIAALREGETSTKVIASMDRVAGAVAAAPAATRSPWQQDGKSGFLALDGEWVSAPPEGEMPGTEPVSKEVLEILRPQIEEFNTNVGKLHKQYAGTKYHWSHHHKVVPVDKALKQLKSLMSGSGVMSPYHSQNFSWLYQNIANTGAVERFMDHPEVSLRHLMRIARVTGGYNFSNLMSDYAGPAGVAMQRRIADGADVRILLALWHETGGTDYLLDFLSARWWGESHGLPDESWPMLLSYMEHLDEALGLTPQKGDKSYSVPRALKLLEMLPKVPERYRARLMILANETGTKVRTRARHLLAEAEGIEDAIALQLDDGKQDVRALAAEWLAQRGATSHIPAIRKRLKKERSDKARAQMITALERLGDDTSDFFDEKAMVAEAEKALKKAMPKGLDWFPFDALPTLTWANGKTVNPILPRHWVVLSARLKQPGGNALVDLWLDRLAPGDAHKLGWMILTGWIAEDTRQPTDEESNKHALAHVDQRLKWNRDQVKRWPSSADYYSTDYDTVFAQIKRAFGSQYLGTATDSKGILALCSRVEGSDAGPRIRSFLTNHGARVSQAKALLEVLANIGSPAALQVLLQSADRLKQKSVQAHAGKLIEEVAERRDWTAAELADRTVPTGGLDEDGTLTLESGQDRTYTAKLDEEDKLALFNASGKEVKALPPARVEDEKAEVAASKKALSKARKEVKQVVSAQTDRFREAMCMERTWSAEDWVNYVAGHPIVGRLAARLVWIGLDKDGEQAATFRPLGDGSFSDVEDEDVEPGDFEKIKLAHSTLLDAKASKAWNDHFADYDVTPLFQQLGRDLPEIDDKTRKLRQIKDREGYMIETFKLRGIATKLGYQRGPAEDGGWFMTYHRTLREAKLVAEIEFTGNALPESNIPAALISLGFRSLRDDGKFGPQVGLDKVPEVLLAETWRDYHDMADKGSGFDPDWQKKAGL